MIRKFFRRQVYRLKHGMLSVENVALMVAILLCATWTIQAVAAMSRNWSLTEHLNMKQKELELLEIEVEMMALENEYYKTEEYQELLARKFEGKKLHGENMVYLPENSEAARSKHAEMPEEAERKEYSNYEKWIMYLFPNN